MKYEEWVETLTLQDYSKVSSRLLKGETGKLLHAGIGISGEAGELIDAIKKHVFYGKPLDVENIKEELGDLIFYVAMACNSMGFTLEQVIQNNIDKLSKRYSSGSFSEKEAQERKDKAE